MLSFLGCGPVREPFFDVGSVPADSSGVGAAQANRSGEIAGEAPPPQSGSGHTGDCYDC